MQTEASPAVQFTERFKPCQRVGLTILACGGTTLLATPLLDHLDLANIVMLFLLTVLLIAVSLGRNAAVLAAVLSVLLFDIFFVAAALFAGRRRPPVPGDLCRDAGHRPDCRATGRRPQAEGAGSPDPRAANPMPSTKSPASLPGADRGPGDRYRSAIRPRPVECRGAVLLPEVLVARRGRAQQRPGLRDRCPPRQCGPDQRPARARRPSLPAAATPRAYLPLQASMRARRARRGLRGDLPNWRRKTRRCSKPWHRWSRSPSSACITSMSPSAPQVQMVSERLRSSILSAALARPAHAADGPGRAGRFAGAEQAAPCRRRRWKRRGHPRTGAAPGRPGRQSARHGPPACRQRHAAQGMAADRGSHRGEHQAARRSAGGPSGHGRAASRPAAARVRRGADRAGVLQPAGKCRQIFAARPEIEIAGAVAWRMSSK